MNHAPHQLYRLRLFWRADDGLSRYPVGTLYVYYTPKDRFVLHGACPGGACDPPLDESNGHRYPVCDGFSESTPMFSGPFDPRENTSLTCYSGQTPRAGRLNYLNYAGTVSQPKGVGTVANVFFPVAVAAIDPVEEARLVGLDHAVTQGRYLRESDRLMFTHQGSLEYQGIPVIASTKTFVGDRLAVNVSRLRVPAGANLPAILASSGCHEHPTLGPCASLLQKPPPDPTTKRAYVYLTHLTGQPVGQETLGIGQAYQAALRGTGRIGRLLRPLDTGQHSWSVSPVRYRILGPNRIVPTSVTNDPLKVWQNPAYGGFNGGYYQAPADNQDNQFRHLEEQQGEGYVGSELQTPLMDVVGRYDPAKLRGFSTLSRVPLETYSPPLLQAGDAATSRLLQGRPLAPSQNLAGYIQQPPLILTTIAALPSLGRTGNLPPSSARAPISVIRVRVRDVHGDDPLSRARIRLVAQEIHDTTGLDVDITAGSSPAPITVDLPAGKYGRPALVLREGWTKKGVAVSYLNAVDRKSLLLFGLILVVCLLFLTNGALAATKARRAEVGILLTIGWSRLDVFRTLLAELVIVGAVAGLAGALLGTVAITVFDFAMPTLEAALVFPLAVTLAAAAGVLPAWQATRLTPVEAIAPPVVASARGRRVTSISKMALVNLYRVPLRTALGCSGLAIGVAAAALLIGIQDAFQGQLVSSVLGQAITVQVRGADEIAVALTIVLAACSLADVLYLNLSERRAELATLRTVGWSLTHVRRLIALEALSLATFASGVGLVVSALIGTLLLALPVHAL
ncbi:MAG: FtsX-like permease family protein, partial [Mycobacteriales bacterium]